MRFRYRKAALLITAATALGALACGGNSITNPRFQPEVSNLTDSFQLQATGVTNVTQTLTYVWQNNGTKANVDQSGAITGGTATLTLRDATGALVYSDDLSHTGSFTSSIGEAGAWSIRLELHGVSGTLNFRVQNGS